MEKNESQTTGRRGSAPGPGSPPERWERRFYNSYGNYAGYRFQDFQAGCKCLVEHCGWWECTHANKSRDFSGHCCLDACPCVEVDGDRDEEYAEWHDAEMPVLVLVREANNAISDTPTENSRKETK